MKKCKKLFVSMLAVIVAVSFMCVPAAPAFAAGDAPYLETDTFWVKDRGAYIYIDKFDEEKDVITSLVSSNPAVLGVVKDSAYVYGWKILPKKPGTVKLTAKCTVNGKNYTLTQSFKVKKYPKAIKKLKINGKTVKVTAKKRPWETTKNKYKKSYVKVKITPKKGWKIERAWFDMGDRGYLYDTKTLKPNVIKKGKKIKFPKKYKSGMVMVMMYHPKTDAFFTYYVYVNR